jgi:hypothetical protein
LLNVPAVWPGLGPTASLLRDSIPGSVHGFLMIPVHGPSSLLLVGMAGMMTAGYFRR